MTTVIVIQTTLWIAQVTPGFVICDDLSQEVRVAVRSVDFTTDLPATIVPVSKFWLTCGASTSLGMVWQPPARTQDFIRNRDNQSAEPPVPLPLSTPRAAHDGPRTRSICPFSKLLSKYVGRLLDATHFLVQARYSNAQAKAPDFLPQ